MLIGLQFPKESFKEPVATPPAPAPVSKLSSFSQEVKRNIPMIKSENNFRFFIQ